MLSVPIALRGLPADFNGVAAALREEVRTKHPEMLVDLAPMIECGVDRERAVSTVLQRLGSDVSLLERVRREVGVCAKNADQVALSRTSQPPHQASTVPPAQVSTLRDEAAGETHLSTPEPDVATSDADFTQEPVAVSSPSALAAVMPMLEHRAQGPLQVVRPQETP